jgi:hypothetical protein
MIPQYSNEPISEEKMTGSGKLAAPLFGYHLSMKMSVINV